MSLIKKVLLIDDEESFTRLMKLNLELNGPYKVQIENRSVKALATALEFRPDIILLDVIMPDVDGGEVAAAMKSHPSLRHVPIVFLTAVVSAKEAHAHGDVIGGRVFLAKPASVEEVRRTIDRCLAQAEKEKKAA